MNSRFGIFGVAVIAASCALAPSGAANAQSFANKELRSSAAPDKCVTAPPGASDNSQLVVQACNNTANQRFTLHPDGHLQAGIKNPQGYDLCVDYYPTQGAEGSAVRLFRCRPFGNGVDSHRWAWDGSRLRGAHGAFLAPAGAEAGLGGATTGVVMSAAPARTTQWVFDAPAAPPSPPVTQAPPQPSLATVASSATVTFYSEHAPGKCIAPASSGGLILWDCVNNPNQSFEYLADGGYLRQSGRCIGNAGEATRFEECLRNATHQQWVNEGSTIRNRNNPAQCLDVERGATANGTRILATSCTGGSNQRWSLKPLAVAVVPAAPPAPPVTQVPPQPSLSTLASSASVTFYSELAPGKCISPSSSGGLILWDCVNKPNQRFEYLADGGYLRQSRRCLGNAGEAIRFEECLRNARHQQWVYEGSTIRNRNNPAQCLDVERGATANGTRILASACSGASNQRWSLQPMAVAVKPTAPITGGPNVVNPPPPSLAELLTPARLEPVEELQGVAQSGIQLLGNLQVFSSFVRRGAAGATPLFEPAVAADIDAAVKYLEHLLVGSPYSLQKLAQGSVVALNQDERDVLKEILAHDDLEKSLRDANMRLQLAINDIQARPVASKQASSLIRNVSYRDLDGFSQRIKVSNGLDRAENLIMQLQFARSLKLTGVFAEQFLQGEALVTLWIGRVGDKLRGPAPLSVGGSERFDARSAKIAGALKAYSAAKLLVQLAAATLNFVVVNVPTRVSGFYVTLADRPYSGQAHVMKVGESVRARVYVIPQSEGGQVVTPIGVLGLVLDSISTFPRVQSLFGPRVMSDENAELYKAMGEHFTKYIAKPMGPLDLAVTAADKTGFSVWAKSIQSSMNVKERNHKPVEINDERVVKLNPRNDRVKTIVTPDRGDRGFTITAVSQGESGIQGILMLDGPLVERTTNNLLMAINVTNDQPPSPPPGKSCIFAASESRIIEGVMINGKCERVN